MPHVIVKLYKGRSDDVKLQLAKKIVENVTSVVDCEEGVTTGTSWLKDEINSKRKLKKESADQTVDQ
jgi:hypothetical protein